MACLGFLFLYLISVVARSAKGRDAEGAKDAGVRGARVVPCVVVWGDTPALVVGG